MARIAGINLPNKPVGIALTYIHGIGRSKARLICDTAGIGRGVRINLLGDDEVVDLLMLLSSFCRHYEHKGERGELLRKWTAREPSAADTEQLARSAFEDWNWYVRGNMN